MRLAAQAWRPRAIAPAYGRGILNSRLPYFDHEHNAQESDRRQPVYDYGSYHHLSLRYQHQDLEPRATSNGDRSQLRKGCSVNFASSVQIQTIVAEGQDTYRASNHAQSLRERSTSSRDTTQNDGQVLVSLDSQKLYPHDNLPDVLSSFQQGDIHRNMTYADLDQSDQVANTIERAKSQGNTTGYIHGQHSLQPPTSCINLLEMQVSYRGEYTHLPNTYTQLDDITGMVKAFGRDHIDVLPTDRNTVNVRIVPAGDEQGACEWAWSPEQIPTTIIGTQDRTAVTVEDAIETDQITDKRDVYLRDSCPTPSPTPTITVVGRTSQERVDEGRGLLSQHDTLTTWARIGDFHESTANQANSEDTHDTNRKTSKSSIEKNARCSKNRHGRYVNDPESATNLRDPIENYVYEYGNFSIVTIGS